jgi:hypothetical protein
MFPLLVAHVCNAKSFLAIGARSRIAAVTCAVAQKGGISSPQKIDRRTWNDDLIAGKPYRLPELII